MFVVGRVSKSVHTFACMRLCMIEASYGPMASDELPPPVTDFESSLHGDTNEFPPDVQLPPMVDGDADFPPPVQIEEFPRTRKRPRKRALHISPSRRMCKFCTKECVAGLSDAGRSHLASLRQACHTAHRGDNEYKVMLMHVGSRHEIMHVCCQDMLPSNAQTMPWTRASLVCKCVCVCLRVHAIDHPRSWIWPSKRLYATWLGRQSFAGNNLLHKLELCGLIVIMCGGGI